MNDRHRAIIRARRHRLSNMELLIYNLKSVSITVPLSEGFKKFADFCTANSRELKTINQLRKKNKKW